MWSTVDTTRALAQARNDEVELGAAKSNAESDPAKAEDKSTSVASVLEALGAVVPTGVIALYSGAALALRQAAISGGADAKAATEAAMAAKGSTSAEIAAALKALPQEPRNFVEGRLAILVFAALVALAMAIVATLRGNEAATKKRRVPFVEPFIAVVAFTAWALASPGTPLAAYHPASQMNAITIVIATVGGLTLVATGNTSLVKPARRAK